jgi:CheY-like chemotaxis protein
MLRNLVIADINMPRINANAVAKHIKSSNKKNIPIVAIIDSGNDSINRELFNFVLLKPFNPDYAVGIVTRIEKPQRNEKLERFCAEGIFINMLRSKFFRSQ